MKASRIPAVALVAGLVLLLQAPLTSVHGQEDIATLKKRFVAACQQGQVDQATSALNLIARKGSKEGVQFLIDAGLQLERFPALNEHGKMRIFDAARSSLAKVDDRESRDFIFEEARRLKRERDAGKKVFLAEVIGRMDGDDSTEALIPLLEARKFPAVQIEAMQALAPRVTTGKLLDEVMDPIIDILEANENSPNLVWNAARNSLVGMTGYEFPSAADWRNFWAVRKGNFDPQKDRGDKKAGGAKTVQRKVPTFFDKEILSKRLVFIIDVSKSMHVKDPVKGGEQPTGGPKTGDDIPCPVCGHKHRGVGLEESRMRVQRVKRELINLIDSLPGDVKFNILAYSTDVLPWKNGDELHQATPKNKKEAVKWATGLMYEEYTSTDRALERAFNHREANAFYLLSDGAPYRDGKPIPKQPIFDFVGNANKTRKVKIFTLGFSEDADTDFLKKLAQENGGTFDVVE